MLDFARELWKFLRIRKKFWLMPVIVIMCGLGGLLMLAEGRRSLRSSILCFEKTMDPALIKMCTSAHMSAFRDCANLLECPSTGEPLVAAEDGWDSRSGRQPGPR